MIYLQLSPDYLIFGQIKNSTPLKSRLFYIVLYIRHREALFNKNLRKCKILIHVRILLKEYQGKFLNIYVFLYVVKMYEFDVTGIGRYR